MKIQVLSAIALSLIMVSCKKEIESKSLSANDISGNGWVKGTLHRTVIAPNGGNPVGWNNDVRVPAANVSIQVRVQTNGATGIYPNSNFQSTEVFTGTTDANGNFSVPVKSNGTSNGVNALVVIEGFQATQDTLINGTAKTGRLCNYFGMSANLTVFKGQSTWWNNIPAWSFANNNMTVASDLTNPNSPSLGTSTITGNVKFGCWQYSVTVLNGTASAPAITNTAQVIAKNGTKVYCALSVDPLTLSTRVYETSTSSGNYTFVLNTVNPGTPGYNQNATVWVSDLAQSRDTVEIRSGYNGTVFLGSTVTTIPGKNGVYNAPAQNNQNGMYSNEIRNAVNFLYTFASFTAN